MASWLSSLAKTGVVNETEEAGNAVAAYVVGEQRVAELAHWFASADANTVGRERRAAIELCISMAHADRVIDPEERHMLRQIVAASALPEDVQDELVASIHSPPPLVGIEARLTHPILRELMLALAWELALCDTRIHGAETELYDALASRLAIERARAEAIRDAVGEQLL